MTDLQALACEDCIAEITLEWQRGLSGRVLVAGVKHDVSCPWLARVAPVGATLSCAHGVITHWSDATAAVHGGEA